MKTLSKRLSALILTAIMAASALAGCGDDKKEESSSAESSASSASSSASSEAEAPKFDKSETVKLVYALSPLPSVTDYETNYFTKWMEEKANVDLEFMLLPASRADAQTKVNLMISSGQDLPDILAQGGDMTKVDDYARKGVLADLTEYWTNPEAIPEAYDILMENLGEKYYDLVIKEITAPDGKIHTMFSGTDANNEVAKKTFSSLWVTGSVSRAWINSEWLEKLNLEKPTTTQELHDVLKAFVEKDPNGNGKHDEVGLMGGNGWGQNLIPFLMNPFEYANPDRQYCHVKDDKIYTSFTQEGWKKGLEYINSLVTEGLVDPASFTQSGEQLKSFINVKGGVVGVVTAGSYGNFLKDDLGEAMVPLAPLKGPDGTQNGPTSIDGTAVRPNWFITSSCKHPDRAFLLAAYMYVPEAFQIARYGVPEEDWVTSGPELDKCIDLPDGSRPKFVVINDYWTQQQNTHWGLNGHIQWYGLGDPGVQPDSFKAKIENEWIKGYSPFTPKENIYGVKYTPEENEATADLRTAINTYVGASIAQFSTGARPLSDWDNYLKDLEKMGLDKYVEVYQAAFDRRIK